ncbi:hypothetical protein BU25DRAFT_239676 [Macroventuria anomochaeta]|uniref:Uncharacterized protein n=1 Tax=Macroventuria anomochaeta TaxID=301207 RepID=A0ACB6RJJ8_9PLEO|nr:uncharacterized protein BU25DRAFT_239676 [Macroventuria anomochaeta]KAF2621278.1 hypothetical protein BU25DRAFT_239676 [Macroventuria anomochaeta]
MAPQRRRGSKHAVKDEDLTHTKYDDYSHEQLLVAVKEAGCCVKDDKKSVVARKLADHDRNLQNAERRAVQERKEKEERRQQEIKDAAKAQKDRRKARAKRNKEKGRRRECEEDVSSNSEDTADADVEDRHDAHKLTVTGGKALSDETWEDTCSDTTVNSENPPIMPDCKRRLFEWSYITMPPVTAPPHACSKDFSMQLTYALLKVITTQSCEKITLLGQKDPAGVDTDYVPVLDPLTRSAARHGHMTGLLAYATIECATSWAARSIVQGWNGRMYFSLSPYNDAKDMRLDAVYRKRYNEQSKLLHTTPGITDLQIDRKCRFSQRLANKRKAVLEVYEACKWRPLAVSYMPAYLDWEKGIDFASLEDFNKPIDNLYYVRDPGCDLPHYYFWARKSEWTDSTTLNPSWSPEAFKQQGTVGKAVDAYTRMAPTQLRVKKLTPVPPLRYDLPNSSDPVTLPSNIERDIYTHGLSATLTKYKAFATSVDKGEAWAVFTRKLPVL